MKMLHPLLVGLFVGLLAVPPAHGWNNTGHMLVAKIAYAQLSDAERTEVIEILEQHPHYATYLAAGCPAEVDPQEWAFLNAATWSDWVRVPDDFDGNVGTHWRYKFDRGKWHYINYPVKTGQSDLTVGEPLQASTNILKQLALSEQIVKESTTDDPGIAGGVTAVRNRAVRLCWTFHLIGDLHQPLHVAAFVEPTRLPGGDQGGNKLAVKKYPNSSPVKLHGLWDGLLGKNAAFDRLEELQEELTNTPGLAPAELGELNAHSTYEQWAQESYELAAKNAYLDGTLPLVLWIDPQQQDQDYRATVPTLTAAQRAKAQEVARRRIVLAGHRLAKKLKEMIE